MYKYKQIWPNKYNINKMNILDGSWISFDKNNLFHQVMDQSQLRPREDAVGSLDRSTNGHLDPIFYSHTKTDESLNESFRFFNRSGMNLNDQSRILNSSMRSSKQFNSGFQPYHPENGPNQEGQVAELNERARMPMMCVATKMQESEEEEPSEKSEEYVVANFKIHNDESLEAHLRSKKNQTKNIPKNYGKAIITFMQKNKQRIIELFGQQATEHQLMVQLKNRKKSINTIKDIRDLWTKSKFSKEFRIISNLFLRKYAFEYIFNSRITNYSSHIKYRHKLREAVVAPESFICIKDKDY